MGLKGDVDEVRAAWSTYSWRLKSWMILSLFLTSGSIASLSETIVRWKGFFLDAVAFYQQYISTPVQAGLAALLPVEVPPGFSDLAVIFLLIASANIRLAVYTTGSTDTRGSAVGIVIGMLGFVVWVLSDDGMELSYGGMITGFTLITILATVIHVRAGGGTRTLWFVSLLGPVFLVGMAAAINAGLTR